VEELAIAGSGILGTGLTPDPRMWKGGADCVAFQGSQPGPLNPGLRPAAPPPPWVLLRRAFSAPVPRPVYYRFHCYRPIVPSWIWKALQRSCLKFGLTF